MTFSGELEMDEGLLRRLFARALARGGDYADIFVERSTTRILRWENEGLAEAELERGAGLGIRVLSGTRTGYAYSEEFDPRALEAVAETAAHVAAGSSSFTPPAVFTSPSLADRYPERRPLDSGDLKERIAQLEAMQARVAEEPRLHRMMASYTESRREILVAGSDGLLVRDSQPMIRINCNVVLEEKGCRETGRGSEGSRMGLELFDHAPALRAADEALRLGRLALAGEEAPAGSMPVVLGPGASGILLHEAVGHGLEADFNHKGTSRFSGRIGEQVASPLCTVVDDPTLPGDRGALNVDDEGCPAERTVLIEQGILRGYLHDRLSARLMGQAPTGNGRRESYRHHPMPRMSNTYLLAGDSEPEEIIASVDRGFYAKHFSGGQVDIAGGDFVFNVTEGYLIEQGRLGPPVKGATLIGNGPEVMGRVSMVGKDLAISPGMWVCGKRGQRVPVNVGLPHLKIDRITVGGTRPGGGA
jgi:TldD protein